MRVLSRGSATSNRQALDGEGGQPVRLPGSGVNGGVIIRLTTRLTRWLALPILAASLPLAVACSGPASATEVRLDGAALTAKPAAGPLADQPAPPPGDRPGEPAAYSLVPPPSAPAPEQTVIVRPPEITARAAIVVDDASGAVLYEYNGRTRIQPASLTKIATAALAIERGNVDDWVTIDFDYTEPSLEDASVMGLVRDDRFLLRDLIYGMMLPSGADAAIAVGRAVSGSDEAFVQDLNDFVRRLGLYDTHFVDPHGLGGPTHLSTAYDLAMLSRYALKQPLFALVAREDVYVAVGSRTITVFNTNPWVYGYRGGDGVKSGYTEAAGPTLVASATRDGHRVIVVVLDALLRNQDTTALMDWAFESFCWTQGATTCGASAAATTPTP